MEKKDLILEVKNLLTAFPYNSKMIFPVDKVSFYVNRKEVFGLAGESGSGKTLTALSIMRLVPKPGKILEGEVFFEGLNLLRLSEKEMEKIRGNKIGIIFQEPSSYLNPVLRIGEQVGEAIRVHKSLTRKEERERVLDLLREMGFEDPERRYNQYPHELSGGQKQRVLIAIALACDPDFLIADEPTTALDVITEIKILELIKGLIDKLKMSTLFITHNLRILREIADRVGLMYAGQIVEVSSKEEFFSEPLHPYGKGLISVLAGPSRENGRFNAISGFVPRLSELPKGCRFHPRCNFVRGLCKREEPPFFEIKGRLVKCFLYQD